MNKVKLASIIITSYNYGDFLKETIDSALKQNYSRTEVIVVDDGSSDNSREIIASYGTRITPILKNNGGQASAFNSGFISSHGDVIFFLDSDDLLLPDAVGNVVKFFDNPQVTKAHWHLWRIDEKGEKTGELYPSKALSDGDLREAIIRNGPEGYVYPPTSGNAWSRMFLEKVLPMPEAEYVTCPDNYLSDLAPLFGLVKKLSEPQGLYRIHGNNNLNRIFCNEKYKRFAHRCTVLNNYLLKSGVSVDPEIWKKSFGVWADSVDRISQNLAISIPEGESFIFVDEDQFRKEFAQGCYAIPFLEHNGQYWGAPPDEETAINELERLHKGGVNFIAFALSAFWWLDYYSGFHNYLRSNFRCILQNPWVVIFDLKRKS